MKKNSENHQLKYGSELEMDNVKQILLVAKEIVKVVVIRTVKMLVQETVNQDLHVVVMENNN